MKPYLRNNHTGIIEKAAVRQLCDGDIPDILALQQSACAAMPDANFYIPGNESAIREQLRSGFSFGLFAENRLCAACFIEFAANDPERICEALSLNEQRCAIACQVTRLFASPDYSGNAIGYELLAHCTNWALKELKCHYVIIDVSPRNVPGLVTILKVNGYRIKALRQRHGCKLRYVAVYHSHDQSLYNEYERLAATDVYNISKLLAHGWSVISFFREGRQLYLWLAK